MEPSENDIIKTRNMALEKLESKPGKQSSTFDVAFDCI